MHHKNHCVPMLSVLLLAAAMLACSAADNLPNPFASATPTATATFTPTATPTPTSTPTSTPTPTPKPTGVKTEHQGDGTTLVRDLDNGYELVFSADWTIIPVDGLEQMLQGGGSGNAEAQQLADELQSMDSDVFRMFGLHNNPKYVVSGAPAMVMVVTVTDPVAASFPMAGVTAMIEDNVFKGSTDTTWDVVTNANGVEVGIVEGSRKASLQGGQKVTMQAKVIAFQANKKLFMVQFEVGKQFAAEVLPGVDALIETIKLSEP